MAIYLFFMFISFIALCLFDWPYIPEPTLVGISMILFVLSNVFYVLTAFTEPGVIEKNENINFVKLVEKMNPGSLCPQCEVYCFDGSMHCIVC